MLERFNKLLEQLEEGLILQSECIEHMVFIASMSARRGVGKGVTGEGLKFDPESRQLLTVYDMNKKGHRMISTDAITGLSFQGINYSIRSTQ